MSADLQYRFISCKLNSALTEHSNMAELQHQLIAVAPEVRTRPIVAKTIVNRAHSLHQQMFDTIMAH